MNNEEDKSPGCMLIFFSGLFVVILGCLITTVRCSSLSRDMRLGLIPTERESRQIQNCGTSLLNIDNWFEGE